MKKALGISAGVLVVLVALVLLLPALVDLGSFKSTYLPLLEENLQRRIDVGEVRLALLPNPSLRISSLKVSDSPASPDSTFFTAQQVQMRLKFWPLIYGRFDISELVVDKPVMHLLNAPDGAGNYGDSTAKHSDRVDKSIPAPKKPERKKQLGTPKAAEALVVPFLVPARVRIKDGKLNIVTKARSPVEINGIDLSLQNLSADRPFSYQASFTYPGLKTISLEGSLSYQDAEAALELKDNYLRIHDIVFPVQGRLTTLSTTPQVDLTLASERVEAKTIFHILSVLGLLPPDTDAAGPMGLRVTVSGPAGRLLTRLYGQFTNVQVNGKRAVKGKVNGEITIQLPSGVGSVSRRLQGSGNLIARDGELTNMDLIKKVHRVTGFMGLSKNQSRQATTFKNLEAEFTIENGFTDFKRVYLSNPQMEVNGAGTMTLDKPKLDFAIETALSAQASARASGAKAANFFKDRRGRIVVPLKITGPVDSPAVDLDSDKLAQRGVPRSFERTFSSLLSQLLRN